jgi:hypothetical protein
MTAILVENDYSVTMTELELQDKGKRVNKLNS